MAGVVVDSASMEKIARQMGEAGKPAPEWVLADTAYRAAYDRGAGRSAPAAFHPPTPPAAQQHRRPARTRTAPPAPRATPAPPAAQGPSYLSRAFSPSGAAQRAGVTGGLQSAVRAGDGGGLLLALVVYPIVLATIKYGPAGPGVWFRAKWLNKPTATPAGARTFPSSRPAVGSTAGPSRAGVQ